MSANREDSAPEMPQPTFTIKKNAFQERKKNLGQIVN